MCGFRYPLVVLEHIPCESWGTTVLWPSKGKGITQLILVDTGASIGHKCGQSKACFFLFHSKALCLWLTTEFSMASAQRAVPCPALSYLSITDVWKPPSVFFFGYQQWLWGIFSDCTISPKVLAMLGCCMTLDAANNKIPSPKQFKISSCLSENASRWSLLFSALLAPTLCQTQHLMPKPEDAGVLAAPGPEQTMLFGSDFTHL